MRKALLLLIFALLTSTSAWAQYDGLIISEVMDGDESGPGFGGVPKYIELYNATSYATYSLENLVIRRYSNDDTMPARLSLGSATLPPEEAYVAGSSGTPPRWDPIWGTPFETPPDLIDFFVNGNGNDVYELYDTLSRETIDIYGIVGEVTSPTDYSPAWAYQNSQVTRREEVNTGNRGSFDLSEWIITPYVRGNATPGAHFANPLGPLPVELISFEAVADGSAATLSWTTASEENNTGFHVEHRRAATGETTTDTATGPFEAIGFVNGAGTTSEARRYRFQTEALEAGRHVFRLRQVDFDGTVSYSSEVELAVASALPEGYRLSAAYPNPFNPQTQFTLSVRQAQEVRVEVFNLLGQRVRLLHEGPLEPEREHTFTFEAGDLPSGLYLYRAQGETFVSSEQVTLLK